MFGSPQSRQRLKRFITLSLVLAAGAFTSTAARAGTEIARFSFPRTASAPTGSLLRIGANYYGMTNDGGDPTCGCGTVYQLAPNGTLTVLHAFHGGNDGAGPSDALINIGTTLYGVTSSGGKGGHGTVFALKLGGAYRVLYSFAGGRDGQYPASALLAMGGVLYGTTITGGSDGCGGYGCGTVFAITPSGAYKQIHDFLPRADDGAFPEASLTNVDGVLYGTTNEGGAWEDGTVFAITPSGRETIVYSFGGYALTDAILPESPLLYLGGRLYGTTTSGGNLSGGTVYSLRPNGSGFSKLYSFGTTANDGSDPAGSLIYRNGVIYGTTSFGGISDSGTVFGLTLRGAEAAVYRFTAKPDGSGPQGGLIAEKGALYGTTIRGGTLNAGTAFAIKP